MRWRSEFVKTRSLLKRSFLPTMANQHRRLNSITREKDRTNYFESAQEGGEEDSTNGQRNGKKK